MPNLTYELPSRSQVRQAGSGSIFTNQQPWRWSISNDQKRDPLTSASGSPATSLLLLVPPSERRQASDLASTSASPEPLLQPDQQTSWSRFEYGDGVKANDHQRFSLECRSGRAGRRKAEGEWRRKGLGGGDSASEKRSKRTRSSPLDPNEILNLRRAIKICFLPPSATGQDEGNGQGSGSRSIELFHSLLPLLLPGRQSARDARWLEGLAKEAVISDRGEVALPSSAFRPPPPPPPLTPGSYTGTGEQLGCSIQESHRPLVQGPNPVEAFKKRRLRGNADEEEDLRIPLPPWWISKASKKKTKKAVEDDSMTTQRSNMEMNVEERRSVPEEAVTAEAVTGEVGSQRQFKRGRKGRRRSNIISRTSHPSASSESSLPMEAGRKESSRTSETRRSKRNGSPENDGGQSRRRSSRFSSLNKAKVDDPVGAGEQTTMQPPSEPTRGGHLGRDEAGELIGSPVEELETAVPPTPKPRSPTGQGEDIEPDPKQNQTVSIAEPSPYETAFPPILARYPTRRSRGTSGRRPTDERGRDGEKKGVLNHQGPDSTLANLDIRQSLRTRGRAGRVRRNPIGRGKRDGRGKDHVSESESCDQDSPPSSLPVGRTDPQLAPADGAQEDESSRGSLVGQGGYPPSGTEAMLIPPSLEFIPSPGVSDGDRGQPGEMMTERKSQERDGHDSSPDHGRGKGKDQEESRSERQGTRKGRRSSSRLSNLPRPDYFPAWALDI